MSDVARTRGGRTFSSVVAHRNFRLYVVGQIVSYSGSFVQDSALPWLALQLTHSPFQVGLLVTFRYLPFSLTGLLGGVVADRVDNRRLLICTQTIMMGIAISLAVFTLAGIVNIWELYVAAFLSGSTLVFDSPSKWSLVYQLVGRDELPNALALNNALQNSSRIVGPAIGGVLIAAVGVGWCFVVNAVSFIAVLTSLLLIRRSEMWAVVRDAETPHPWKALREGIDYLRTAADLKLIVGTACVFGIFAYNPLRTLIAVLAARTVHTGPETYGVLFACYGGGAVVGGLVAATFGRASFRWLFGAALGFSLALIVLAPLHSAVLAGVLLFAIGCTWSIWQSQAQTLVQLAAPDRLRGRVVSTYTYSLLAGAPLGAMLGGYLAEVGGTQLAFLVGGGASLVSTLVLGARLSHRRTSSPEPQEA